MATVTLRFYGRFVFAQEVRGDVPTGRLTALAPVFDTARFCGHAPAMTIRRDRLDFSHGDSTTLQPATKAIADGPILESELFTWNLSGLNVSYDVSTPPAELVVVQPAELLPLEQLEDLRGRKATLARDALVADPHGRSNATIAITSGTGIGTALAFGDPPTLAKYVFVTETDATDGQPCSSDTPAEQPPGNLFVRIPVDLVEFSVNIGARETLRLTFTSATGRVVGYVSIKPGTVVSFSHLCAELPPDERKYDLEFAQYYTLLADPVAHDGLVPRVFDCVPFSEGADCDTQARIRYEADPLAAPQSDAARKHQSH